MASFGSSYAFLRGLRMSYLSLAQCHQALVDQTVLKPNTNMRDPDVALSNSRGHRLLGLVSPRVAGRVHRVVRNAHDRVLRCA